MQKNKREKQVRLSASRLRITYREKETTERDTEAYGQAERERMYDALLSLQRMVQQDDREREREGRHRERERERECEEYMNNDIFLSL